MEVEIAPVLSCRPRTLMTVSMFDHVSGSKRFKRLLWRFNALLAPYLNGILPFGHNPSLGLSQFTGGGQGNSRIGAKADPARSAIARVAETKAPRPNSGGGHSEREADTA
jgi:hypothetical protein